MIVQKFGRWSRLAYLDNVRTPKAELAGCSRVMENRSVVCLGPLQVYAMLCRASVFPFPNSISNSVF